MLAKERRIQIVNLIIKQKIVHVSTLAQELGVSEMTIRRDLNSLEKDGILTRTHGGAIFNEEFSSIIDYSKKMTENRNLKMEIAEYAAGLIKDGNIVAINTSTICSQIAHFIGDKNITVVTNALDVANTLSYSKQVNLIFTGGTYIPKYRSFEGTQTIQEFSSHHYDKAFVGTNGIDKSGIYTGGSLESKAKKTIIKQSKQAFVLAEPKKFNVKGQHLIAKINEPTIISINLPQEITENFPSSNLIDIHKNN